MENNRVASYHRSEASGVPHTAVDIGNEKKSPVACFSGSVFRHPETLQEKWLCCLASFLIVVSLMLVSILCIVIDRWKLFLSQPGAPYVEDDHVCLTDACKESAEMLLSNMDSSVDPCVDFYQYSCGGRAAQVEADPTPNYFSEFEELDKRNTQVMIDLLESYNSSDDCSKSVSNAKKLYRGCMNNNESRESMKDKPLVDLLQELGGWPMLGRDSWSAANYYWPARTAEVNRKLLLDVLVTTSVTSHLRDNTRTAILVSSPEFIFVPNLSSNDTGNEAEKLERLQRLSDAYVNYIVQAAQHLGSTEDAESLTKSALEIIVFEAALMNLSKSSENEEIPAIAEISNVSVLQGTLDEYFFDWAEYINMVLKSSVKVNGSTELYIYDFAYLSGLSAMISSFDLRVVANYIGWAVVYYTTDYSSDALRDISAQYDELARGSNWTSLDRREVRCFRVVNQLMEFAVGRIYVDHRFPREKRDDVKTMVDMIRLAYTSTLLQNKWMDLNTKKEALDKLKEMGNMIGYPEWIKNDRLLDEYYDMGEDINEKEFFASVVQLISLKGNKEYISWNRTISRIDSEDVGPMTVNALYARSSNYMLLPVGIFGYPFYDFSRIDSMNYGALGSVIGHEISHAFDTTGRLFDQEGNLRDWWSNRTTTKFKAKSDCFSEQYDQLVEPLTQMKLNGNRTLPENIADNGGLRNAFKAFRLHLSLYDVDNRRQKLPGISETPEQLFFLGYASVWCHVFTRKYMESALNSDAEHSPNQFRVTVPLSNLEEFARAYKCAPGSPMNPRIKCKLW